MRAKPSIMGLVPLQERPKKFIHPFYHSRSEEVPPDTESASVLTLHLPDLRTMSNKCLSS